MTRNHDAGVRPVLDGLIVEALEVLRANGVSLPGLDEAAQKVLRSRTSSRKVVLLRDLIEWVDGIDSGRASEMQRTLKQDCLERIHPLGGKG